MSEWIQERSHKKKITEKDLKKITVKKITEKNVTEKKITGKRSHCKNMFAGFEEPEDYC